MSVFMLRVDGGEPQVFETATGIYNVAALQAFGKLNMPFPCHIEIWSPELVPEYGPYFYRIDNFVDSQGNVYGTPGLCAAAPSPSSRRQPRRERGDDKQDIERGRGKGWGIG